MGERLVVIGDSLKKRFPKATLIYRGVNMEEFQPLKNKRDSLGWTFTDNEAISIKEVEEISKNSGLKFLVAKGIPKDKMNEFYNRCKVFLNLPRTAGFNLAWLEAMSAGVPIIIGNENGAGSFLPIDKVSNQGRFREEIGKIIGAHKRINYRKWLVDKRFSWEEKTEELIKFFSNMKK